MDRVYFHTPYACRCASLRCGESLKENRCAKGKSLRKAIYSGESFDWCGNALFSVRRADKETHYRHPYCILKLRGEDRICFAILILMSEYLRMAQNIVVLSIDLVCKIGVCTDNSTNNGNQEKTMILQRSILGYKIYVYTNAERIFVTYTHKDVKQFYISFSKVNYFSDYSSA